MSELLLLPPNTGQRRPSLKIAPSLNWVNYAMFETAAGIVAVAWRQVDGRLLLSRIFLPGSTSETLRKTLAHRYPNGGPQSLRDSENPGWLPELVDFLTGYYAPQPHTIRSLNLKTWIARLDPRNLTPFRRQVMEALAGISPGKTISYGQLAALVGRPGAARAIGAIMRTNPWPILIPCHRVVGAAGQLTGFSAPGGVCAKLQMLERERIAPGIRPAVNR